MCLVHSVLRTVPCGFDSIVDIFRSVSLGVHGYRTTAPFTQAGVLYLYLFSWQKGGIEGGTEVIGAAKVHMKKALI